MDQNNLSLDLLLQETLALTEYLRTSTPVKMDLNNQREEVQISFLPNEDDTDYLLDLADSIIQEEIDTQDYSNGNICS
jgi:hypothetical protein